MADQDWYRFSCNPGERLRASVLAEGVNGSRLDPELTLEDGAGMELARNASVGTGLRNARLAYTMTSAASHLLRVEGLSGTTGDYRLRAYCRALTAATRFADVGPSHPFRRFIEAFSAAQITSGCGNGNYCPDATVTRGQMAVFIARALGLVASARIDDRILPEGAFGPRADASLVAPSSARRVDGFDR